MRVSHAGCYWRDWFGGWPNPRTEQQPISDQWPLRRSIAISMSCDVRRQMLFEIPENVCVHVQIRALPFRDGVSAAGIHAHVKLLAERNQLVYQQLESLEVHVVVS